MKALVTGHKVYIGSHLFKALIGHRGIDTILGIDLQDGDDILHCLPDKDFDVVFHFAAFPRVEYSVLNPSYTFRQNALVTSVLLDWSRKHNVKKFIFSSSSAIMGDGDGMPKSPYGAHKLMSEIECNLYRDLYGIQTTCLRYFNVYSENQPYGGAYTTAISAWMEMIKTGHPLRIDGDGEQTRDFVHVDDVVSANLLAMERDDMNDNHYDVGCGRSYSLNYVKNFIDQHHTVSWDHAPERKGDARNTLANINPLKEKGWKPSVDFDQGLGRCFIF